MTTQREGHGDGGEFVDDCIHRLEIIIADRARPNANGFGEAIRFSSHKEGIMMVQQE